MKKLLLLGCVATACVSINAATFTDYFKLTYEDQVLANGQTVAVETYYDPLLVEYPEMNVPGYEPVYMAKATVKASNLCEEGMDIAFMLTPYECNVELFQLCYEFNEATGNCLSPKNGVIVSPSNLPAIDAGGFIAMDIDQMDFTDLTPVKFKLDLCVMEGGEKIEGTDYSVILNFIHTKDITAGVGSLASDNAAPEYFTLQGIRVVQPEKGNIYIVRMGSKVAKRIF